jgi:hypothetical protein
MLFQTTDIAKTEQANKGVLPLVQPINTQLAYLQATKTLASYVGGLAEGQTIRYVSKGQWSMHDLIRYCCEKLGEPCEIYLVTWTVTNTPVECLLQLKKEGYLKALHCLFDYRIKDTKPEAFQLIASFADRVQLTKVHAKVTVMVGEKRGFSIVSSANLTKNPRIEAGVIFCDLQTAIEDKTWIETEMNLCTQRNNLKKLKTLPPLDFRKKKSL